MSIADNIKALREKYKLTQAELGEIAGVSDKAVSTWERGDAVPRMGAIERMAAHFGVTKSVLIEDSPTPVFEAAAGTGIICDVPVEEINMSLKEDETVAYVRGRSMEPTLLDGDIVVVRVQSVPNYKNQICLVKINGEENTFKRVTVSDDGITLIADNTSVYPPHFYSAQEVEDLPVRIMGVVVRLVREVK